jgi:hypothetical protein
MGRLLNKPTGDIEEDYRLKFSLVTVKMVFRFNSLLTN